MWRVGASAKLGGAVTAPAASDALAHARRQDAELVAILRDRATRNLDARLLQDFHDGLVGERILASPRR